MTLGKEQKEFTVPLFLCKWVISDAPILRPAKLTVLICSLSLQLPNSRLENSYIFYLSVFDSIAKNQLLDRKYTGGAHAHPCTPKLRLCLETLR